MSVQISKSEHCVPYHKYTYYAIFHSFRVPKEPIGIFFSRMLRRKKLTEHEKAQIESLCAAGKSYAFIVNYLYRSKGCIQDFVRKR